MLSTRTGSVSTASAAGGIARYFTNEQTMAAYYGRKGAVVASPEMVERLGLPAWGVLDEQQVANLMRGLRADGRQIDGRTQRRSNADGTQKRTGFLDMTWSAGKSVSVAIALSDSHEEREALMGAHRRAVAGAMEYAKAQMAVVRRGRGGRLGTEAGDWSYAVFDHFTSRPHEEGATPEPQTHTHALVWNVIVTPEGHVGSMDLSRLKDRTKEFGAVYQTRLAKELSDLGVAVAIGEKHGEAVITTIPQHVVDAFSSRHRVIEQHAKAKAGPAWEQMPERERNKRLRFAVLNTRQAKSEGEPVEKEWRERARMLGYRHTTVLRGALDHPVHDIEAAVNRIRERGVQRRQEVNAQRKVRQPTQARKVQQSRTRRITPQLDQHYNRGGGRYDDDYFNRGWRI